MAGSLIHPVSTLLGAMGSTAWRPAPRRWGWSKHPATGCAPPPLPELRIAGLSENWLSTAKILLVFSSWNPSRMKNNTLLRVIPTMAFIRFVTGKSSGILSDISYGIRSGILSGISSGILPGISSGICSGISSGIQSGILSGISSGICSGVLSGILSGKSSGVLSGKHSGTLSGIPSGILSDILSGILSSGVLSGISSGILSGRWSTAGPLSSEGPRLRSRGAHEPRKVPGWGPVDVQRCPVRSDPCGWGPAVPTQIEAGSWGPAVPTACGSWRRAWRRVGKAEVDMEVAEVDLEVDAKVAEEKEKENEKNNSDKI